jgi:hypothetical protein
MCAIYILNEKRNAYFLLVIEILKKLHETTTLLVSGSYLKNNIGLKSLSVKSFRLINHVYKKIILHNFL